MKVVRYRGTLPILSIVTMAERVTHKKEKKKPKKDQKK